MGIEASKVRSFRLRAHHLDKKIPIDRAADAAGACGLQNTPPGAWETSLFNRLENCTLNLLHDNLYDKKVLTQAWSFRGAPVVFPTAESGIFLTPLIAQKGEQPWIYTTGITGALEHLQMEFGDLLCRTREAIRYLDRHTIKSKEALDRTLADIIQDGLPKEKWALWGSPSMYGNSEKQTVGDAAVSFLLRPCSFHSLVVLGRRQGTSPTFTSFKNWTGHAPSSVPDADKELVRRFLHCYGPATIDYFAAWLGCSPRQAKRLWGSVLEEIKPVQVDGKTCYILATDMDSLAHAEGDEGKLMLLGPHDPYLDQRDRTLILEDTALHKTVWQYVSNPGAVLRGGRIIGTWKAKTLKEKLDVSVMSWEKTTANERLALQSLAEVYAQFRRASLRNYVMEGN